VRCLRRSVVLAVLIPTFVIFFSLSALISDGQAHLVTYEEFVYAWGEGHIQPVTEWNNGFESHYPGMSGQLRVSNLVVMEEIPRCPGEAGLVMAWGDSVDNGQEIIAAWQYYPGPLKAGFSPGGTYQTQDFLPVDLGGMCVHVCVFPPCEINTISVGMKDLNGNIKSWDWSVGQFGVLPCDTQNCLTFGLDGGEDRADATSFYEDSGFDIHAVALLIFDENGEWVDSVEVDPGGFNQHVWNYWKNIRVEQPTAMQKVTWGRIKAVFR